MFSAPIVQLLNGSFRTKVRQVTGIYLLLIGANAVAWAWTFFRFSGRPTLLGVALLAYIFGLWHAVDTDHIVAIDNVVRKLLHEGKRPHLTGLYFSLGHSIVVGLATLAVAAGGKTLQNNLDLFYNAGGAVGAGISTLFCWLSPSPISRSLRAYERASSTCGVAGVSMPAGSI